MKAPRRVPKRRFQKLLTRVGEWFLCIIIIVIIITIKIIIIILYYCLLNQIVWTMQTSLKGEED